MKRLTIILAVLPLLAGCTTPSWSYGSMFSGNEDIALIWKGQKQVGYEEDSYQIGYNSGRHEYRVYDDKLSNWFIVRCSEKPVTEGQKITAEVSWAGKSRTKELKDVEFTVKKTDETGLVWLWSQKERIEVVIPAFQEL